MPRKQPLYPHIPKSRKQASSSPISKPTREDVTVESWTERDRLGIWINEIRTDKTIVEWWDEEAREMFDEGFFKPATFTSGGALGGAPFIDSVLDYAESIGLLANISTHKSKRGE